jgi:dienelactone hydrolase
MIRRLLLSLLVSLPALGDVPTAAESFPGITVEPTSFQARDGTSLRAVVTRPAGARGRLPAILFVQWLSCDSVAVPRERRGGWKTMLARVVERSGALVWRSEKRGVGGSGGDCATLDYDTELDDHRQALAALRRRRDVDPARVVIFGASMGATMAPLLADAGVAGVAVWGGGARTWAERTLAFERNRVELGDGAAGGRGAEVTARLRFIERFLVGRQTPEQIAAADPELGAVWRRFAGSGERTLYGRPFAFHWQAQAHDWAAAWGRVRAPTLVAFGAFDWFEDPAGAALIAEIVNREAPGRAQFVLIPGLDHHFARYPDARAAFAERGGTVDPGPFVEELLRFIRGARAAPPRSPPAPPRR